MTNSQAATITAAERALAVFLAEWGVPNPRRRTADAIRLPTRHGPRPTTARSAALAPRRVGVRDASTARQGAEQARRLLAAQSGGDG
ncbi:hypothetical protein [Nonomuraea sp. NPDC003754]